MPKFYHFSLFFSIAMDSPVREDSSTFRETQDKSLDDISSKEENLVKPITFSWPCKGNIIIQFSPSQIIYDEILDQYRTSNGVVMKTQSKELTSMCDGKITSIFTTSDYEKEITIKKYI